MSQVKSIMSSFLAELLEATPSTATPSTATDSEALINNKSR